MSIRSRIKAKSIMPLTKIRQCGAALIATIFVITALAGLGALMTQRLVLGSTETINEWYSGQALAAAESGIQWAIWDLANGSNGGIINNGVVVNNQAWMSTRVSTNTVNGNNFYIITSIGMAGGIANNPRTQRQIIVKYMP